MTFREWYKKEYQPVYEGEGVDDFEIAEMAFEAGKQAERDEWFEVFGHLGNTPDECGNLINEGIKERSLILDKPEDRLYHAEDKTWWRRNKNGNLKRAEEPIIDKVIELEEALQVEKSYVKKYRDAYCKLLLEGKK